MVWRDPLFPIPAFFSTMHPWNPTYDVRRTRLEPFGHLPQLVSLSLDETGGPRVPSCPRCSIVVTVRSTKRFFPCTENGLISYWQCLET